MVHRGGTASGSSCQKNLVSDMVDPWDSPKGSIEAGMMPNLQNPLESFQNLGKNGNPIEGKEKSYSVNTTKETEIFVDCLACDNKDVE